MQPLTWTTGPDADTCALTLGGEPGEMAIDVSVWVRDRDWSAEILTTTETVTSASGPCASRHDGRRAALDAIEATLQTALLQVRDWRARL